MVFRAGGGGGARKAASTGTRGATRRPRRRVSAGAAGGRGDGEDAGWAGRQGGWALRARDGAKPFDEVYFGAWFAEAIDKAGLPDDCVLHGLRKTAGRKLREAGCTEQQIMDVTGHKTSRMIAKYTKGADQKKGAKAAMRKWENAK